MIRAPYSRQMSIVSSVLNESTTRISSAHLTDSSVSRTDAALLKVGSRMEIGWRIRIRRLASFGRLAQPDFYHRPHKPNRQHHLGQNLNALHCQQTTDGDKRQHQR